MVKLYLGTLVRGKYVRYDALQCYLTSALDNSEIVGIFQTTSVPETCHLGVLRHFGTETFFFQRLGIHQAVAAVHADRRFHRRSFIRILLVDLLNLSLLNLLTMYSNKVLPPNV